MNGADLETEFIYHGEIVVIEPDDDMEVAANRLSGILDDLALTIQESRELVSAITDLIQAAEYCAFVQGKIM